MKILLGLTRVFVLPRGLAMNYVVWCYNLGRLKHLIRGFVAE